MRSQQGLHYRLEVHLQSSWEMLARSLSSLFPGAPPQSSLLPGSAPCPLCSSPSWISRPSHILQQLLSSPVSPWDAPLPWCLLHMVQTARHPTSLHSLHPHPSGFSQDLSTTACFTCLSFLILRLLLMPSSHHGGVLFKTRRGVKEGSISFKPRAHSLNKTILRHLMCKTNPADPLSAWSKWTCSLSLKYYPWKVRKLENMGV